MQDSALDLRPGICFTSTLAAWNAGPQEVTIQAWN